MGTATRRRSAPAERDEADVGGRPSVTESSLRRDLNAIGVAANMALIVHSSLRSIGWVEGGPATVVRALLGALGQNGTLVMPAATPQCAARTSALFDPLSTPTTMGAIPEAFRTWPGTHRSNHPLESVCARGPAAAEITREHPLEFSEGPGTPFGRLHDLDSWILLIGVGFNRCTALHFAESLAANRRTATVGFPWMRDGRRGWVEVTNVADDNDTHFPIIGDRYVRAGRARGGAVGEANATLFPMRDLVEFAVAYFDSTLKGGRERLP